MVVKNANIHNIMGGMESTGGVRLHNHRRKLKQRFDIIRKLGQGTYGKVQLGINKETGQEVAIKTIKKAKIETEADLIRIRREIQIMSSVQHPNIIHIYEVFENREKMVLVMEYAAGGELYDYLSERKVLPQDEARRIFRQIATAVFYCHKHKICHRDLKLENILLDEHGSAKIADFGLSNVFDEQRLLNTFCGSPLYASPEIVKGTPYHGPEVDCWSLGVLLYTLVYGAMPFDGSNFKRLVKQISQGDYFEPKKPSPASSLIRDMLTVPPAKRADIEKVCSHWWVNEGYSDSCLQIAEELADQTPVRLDLLLSLAPPPSGVGTENIMQQGMSNAPSVPHAMVPTRCHSVGSLMELDHTATEQQQQQQQQRTFGAIGKQPLYGDSVAQSAQSTSCATAGHWDSTKRKLEEGASSSEVNLRGAVKRDRGKRKSYEESADVQMSSGRTKHSGENEMEEQTTSEVQPEDEKMDIEEISDPVLSGAAHAPESMESSELSKDSGVEIRDDSLNTSEMEQTCKSSTVSSTATIIPAEESSSAMPSPDEHVPNEPTLSDNNKSKKPIKKKAESVSDLKMSGDLLKGLEKSRSAVANEKKDSILLKEPSKGVSGTKEKQKKVSNAEVNEASKTSKVIAKNDTGNAINKTSKAAESVVNSSKNISASAGKDEKENEIPKTNTKAVKSKGDLVLENLNSEASSTPNTSEPSTPPAGTMERRRSKIFETADKFNNILSGSPETKNVARDKPKKLFIPGVKVSDFKKAFERKLSSPEISVAAFSKKYPTKSDEITSEKSEKPQSGENENVNGIQKGTSSASEVHENNLKGKPTEGELVQDDSKGKKSKSGRNSQVTEDNKKEYTVDSNKSKSLKSSPESKKSSKSVINKSSDSAVEGRNLETMQPAANTVDSTDIKAKTENDKDQELVHNDKKVIPTETVVSAQDAGNDVTIKPSKPNETAGKKKSSKVEITLKSATLPRRKTSKAEIKLDPAIPPIEYKTEIEHMVNTPTTVPLHIRRSDEEHAVPETTMPFRSWSLEPESPHLGKMPSHECIIPIQIERETREGSSLMSPPVGRPPAYPFQQRSMSQSQRSSTLSRQSTQESDSEVMEPIRKSPREYIIPIAVEGGGYVTPRAGSLEPSASDDAKSRRSMSSSTRSNHYRRMSSLLSDTSEDEGFNMSPGGLQRHGSLSRGRDDGRTFHFHRLRSSRPMRHSLEHNDSLSSAEEDDDDDDDEGFEILTAESLFSTLLSRVRSLTQRLTVEDGKRPGFPSNHFVNQLSNINNPSTSFKNFYSHHREPLSRRLSETSSFPRLLNRGGDFGPMHQRSLSRDSSNCDSVNSEGSCTVGTFPRASVRLTVHVPGGRGRGKNGGDPQHTSSTH